MWHYLTHQGDQESIAKLKVELMKPIPGLRRGPSLRTAKAEMAALDTFQAHTGP